MGERVFSHKLGRRWFKFPKRATIEICYEDAGVDIVRHLASRSQPSFFRQSIGRLLTFAAVC